ncbi:hypothetical protein GALMADRAFT_368445 [Galerina marginata CBS 339.88]|uniref:Uncharacterized protein n=1 Tax=Galerina marginata (strain CBS 339.88) TaxID=685588 RepID=A0A067TQU5_GALM3|nr:hypothetical protein GALMADRAFT_368445 [Galerina marginata CBS 339.88]
MSPANSHGLNQNAERLKVEGNEFHQKGQYKAAYRKYTQAIKEDPKNAVYFANRAAASLALKEFLDAASDADKVQQSLILLMPRPGQDSELPTTPSHTGLRVLTPGKEH